MRRIWFLIIPAITAILANQTDFLPFKMGVPLLCSLILLLLFRSALTQQRDIWFIVAAFVFSAIGDYFLSNKSGNELFFVVGIGFYFVAHLGYLGFAWRNGRLHTLTLALLLLIFLPYYFLLLNPAISDTILTTAVFLYLLISCLALAVAAGNTLPPAARWAFISGIALIVLSDTIISFNEFLGYRNLNGLILPTYYLAHLAVSTAVILRHQPANQPAMATI